MSLPIAKQVEQLLRELMEVKRLGAGHVVVIGASTSEVAGHTIGTSGAESVAEQLFAGISAVQQEFGFALAFQCCEHLNRALVIERALLQRNALSEVSAVPIASAGGSMASYAYRHLTEPCLVEEIKADAGVDIGDTLIGMHLRQVAVPFRSTIKMIGHAHATAAYTRPKLIGGSRAVYTL